MKIDNPAVQTVWQPLYNPNTGRNGKFYGVMVASFTANNQDYYVPVFNFGPGAECTWRKNQFAIGQITSSFDRAWEHARKQYDTKRKTYPELRSTALLNGHGESLPPQLVAKIAQAYDQQFGTPAATSDRKSVDVTADLQIGMFQVVEAKAATLLRTNDLGDALALWKDIEEECSRIDNARLRADSAKEMAAQHIRSLLSA